MHKKQVEKTLVFYEVSGHLTAKTLKITKIKLDFATPLLPEPFKMSVWTGFWTPDFAKSASNHVFYEGL